MLRPTILENGSDRRSTRESSLYAQKLPPVGIKYFSKGFDDIGCVKAEGTGTVFLERRNVSSCDWPAFIMVRSMPQSNVPTIAYSLPMGIVDFLLIMGAISLAQRVFSKGSWSDEERL
jgi:hypothetical protein